MRAPRSSPEFRLEIEAQPSDIDELEHVSNIAYVRWIQDAAAAHSAAVGLTWPEYQRIGGMFVVRKHSIEYLRSALLGDRIELVTWVADFRGAATERRTRILRMADGVELAHATTTWAYLSRESGRPVRIPPDVVAAFGVKA
jgi:acyl-CoA thioester hydrolase